MAKLTIEGGHQLSGEIKISGAKNSAVALLPAAVLAHEKSTIYNVPEISDIEYLIDIMNLFRSLFVIEFIASDLYFTSFIFKISCNISIMSV